MKVKSFKDYLNKRLDKKEIAVIEKAAKMEFETLKNLQQDVAKALTDYMARKNLGFNDVVQQLGKSPSQISKIIKGEANLTLATVAQLYAFVGRKVRLVTV